MNAVGNMQTSRADSIELLRTILEQTSCRDVTPDKTAAVGDCLVRFYELLAEQVDGRGREQLS